MKVFKLFVIMFALSAVIITAALIVYMNKSNSSTKYTEVSASVANKESQVVIDPALSSNEDNDAESLPDPDPSQFEEEIKNKSFEKDSIYGTWELFDPENPEDAIERITYREDGIAETIRKPGTEFERSFITYFRVKPYEDEGFILYTYMDQYDYDIDETNSLKAIGLLTDNVLPLYRVIMPSGHVMANQPEYLRKIN